MSAYRSNIARKRRSDDESSSDCELADDVPPLKKARENGRELTFKQIVASKCKGILSWLTGLPVGGYLKETMLNKSALMSATDIITIDEDEEEQDDFDVEVELSKEANKSAPSSVKQDSGPASDVIKAPRNKYTLFLKNKPKQTLSGPTQSSFNISSKPLSSSTPFYRGRNNLSQTTNNVAGSSLNGFHTNGWRTRESVQNRSFSGHRRSSGDLLIAPLTSPGIDVDILLDTRLEAAEDSDGLEIVTEVPSAKRPPKYTRHALPRICQDDRSFKVNDSKPKVNGVNGKESSVFQFGTEKAPSSPTYTAHEVVRLQEVEQYKLLLDKMVNMSVYHPVKKNPQPDIVEVDLTQDDEPELDYHFKKEALQKPVNEFLQTYYKPCSLRPVMPKTSPAVQTNIAVKTKIEDARVVDVQIPTYKSKYAKEPNFFSSDWISELKTTINAETEKRLRIVSQQEEKLARYQKRRDAKLALEMNLRNKNRIFGGVIEDVSIEDEFPDLTPEMEDIVNQALGPGSREEVLVKVDNTGLTRGDFSSLAGVNWLNDSVMCAYMSLIVERNKAGSFPTVHGFNSFFYSSLQLHGSRGAIRSTRKIDVFSLDLLLIPLHLHQHWALIVVDNRFKTVKYYDALHGNNPQHAINIIELLVIIMKVRKDIDMDPNTYSIELVKTIPQQQNGYDCGVFALKYADYIARDAPITFTQTNMPYFRRKIAYELMTNKIL